MKRLLLLFCLFVLMVWSAAPAALAQDTGNISGTVHDASGAVVPGAEVQLSSSAGGLTRTTTSNDSGDYLLPALPGGTYALTVTAKGFQPYEVKDFILRVAQKARVDVTLKVGTATTKVEVRGESVAQVETQSSDLSGTVTGSQITQLQLNGRNFTQLASLIPGVTNQSGADEPGTGLATVAYSVNGGRTEYNSWQIDGGSNVDDGSNTTLITYPSLESIAEVKVLTSNYGAQYGRNGSGTIEVETKSGTSSFHGNLYEFVRNDAFNARNYFLDTVPSYKKNDFGYTIGGPIYIPGHYNKDKTKTFFFFSEEWRKDVVPGANFNVPVPSLAERGCTSATPGCVGNFGNFSDMCPNVSSGAPSFSDCPIDPNTGTYFPGNLVPVDPLAKPLMGMIPLPTGGVPGAEIFQAAPSQPTNWREELVRIDHNFNSKVHGAFRFIHDSWDTVTPNPTWTNGGSYPTITNDLISPGVGLVARLTVAFSPTLLNEFVFSYSTNHITFQNNGAWQRPPGYNVGLFQNGFGGGKLPGIEMDGGAFGGIAQDAGYVPNGPLNSNPQYEYRDNVSKIIGKHNLQFGGYFLASQKNELPQFEPSVNGFIDFSTASAVTTGNAFADLLNGRINSFSQGSDQPKYYLRYKIFEPYFQDDWRVTPRLTLNLGIRLSIFGTTRDRYHLAYNFDPHAYSAATAPQIDIDGSVTGSAGALIPGSGNPFDGIVQCGGPGGPFPIPGFPNASVGGTSHDGCMEGHLFNPAPRVGFAFDPFGDGKTAIRGGYGIFWEHTNGNEATATQLEGSPPLVQTPSQSNIVGYSNVGAIGLTFPLTVVSIPSKAEWPYVQQWHFDVQREFWKNTVATVSYVGSKGTHLGRRVDLNQLPPVPAADNPYVSGEAMGPNDCTTGTTPSGVVIPGYVPGGIPVPGTPGVNMYVACGNSADPFRPFVGFGSIRALQNKASSSYNALQVNVRRNLGPLQFTFAYTYSHSIDDSSSGGDSSFVDTYDPQLSRGSSNFDQRHVFSISYIYDLPFFKEPGLTHILLGGWQWSGITTIQTGAPFSIYNSGDNAGVGNGVGSVGWADVVGDTSAGSSSSIGGCGANGNIACFGPLFGNPNAFVAPQGLTFGDAGRNSLRNPRQTNFDMALFKRFPIQERYFFEFRAEAFNIFNHTQFGYIGGDTGSAANNSPTTAFSNTLGTGQGFLRPAGAHDARILQLGLKFNF